MAKTDKKEDDQSEECFVIMPISDPDTHERGHFRKVYEDIISEACKKAGYRPTRADEVKQTNLIHLDILQRLLNAPMAICDLSTRNPNVLFELGLRQAFDKPTVLIQEEGTPAIFDISPLRYAEYRKELKYREVLEDQIRVAEVLTATKESYQANEGVLSIVSLLSLNSPATLKETKGNETAQMLKVLMAEVNQLRNDIRTPLKHHASRSVARDPAYSFISEDTNQMYKQLLKLIYLADDEQSLVSAVDKSFTWLDNLHRHNNSRIAREAIEKMRGIIDEACQKRFNELSTRTDS